MFRLHNLLKCLFVKTKNKTCKNHIGGFVEASRGMLISGLSQSPLLEMKVAKAFMHLPLFKTMWDWIEHLSTLKKKRERL